MKGFLEFILSFFLLYSAEISAKETKSKRSPASSVIEKIKVKTKVHSQFLQEMFNQATESPVRLEEEETTKK